MTAPVKESLLAAMDEEGKNELFMFDLPTNFVVKTFHNFAAQPLVI